MERGLGLAPPRRRSRGRSARHGRGRGERARTRGLVRVQIKRQGDAEKKSIGAGAHCADRDRSRESVAVERDERFGPAAARALAEEHQPADLRWGQLQRAGKRGVRGRRSDRPDQTGRTAAALLRNGPGPAGGGADEQPAAARDVGKNLERDSHTSQPPGRAHALHGAQPGCRRTHASCRAPCAYGLGAGQGCEGTGGKGSGD